MTAPTVAELLSALGRAAPWQKAAGWDPVGLQLGDGEGPARRVAVCHEVTPAVVAAVEEDPPDLLVTYHPLLFRPVDRLVAGAGPGGRALRLIRSEVALAVAHTNFDAAPGGTADALATALELAHPEAFAPVEGAESLKLVTFVPAEAVERVAEALGEAGAGVVGNYRGCSFRVPGTGTFYAGEGAHPVAGQTGRLNREPEVRLEMSLPASREPAVVAALRRSHPYEEPAYDLYPRRGELGLVGRIGSPASGTTLEDLARLVGDRLGGRGLRVAGEPSAALQRVAVLPGSGADYLLEAARRGADAMVTGDVPHHRAAGALAEGLAVVDPGHAATERPGVRALAEAVAKLAPETVDLTDLHPGPWWS